VPLLQNSIEPPVVASLYRAGRCDWTPITLKEWRRRMKWHDPAETVMDWDGLLYDGWEPVGAAGD
jgi:hypothetical protein